MSDSVSNLMGDPVSDSVNHSVSHVVICVMQYSETLGSFGH